MLAMIGDEALVPPKTCQPPIGALLSNTDTPVAGSATADTSPIMRFLQMVSCCHAGLATVTEQPLFVPSVALVFHTDSVKPRAFDARFSAVPPTAVTLWNAAGICGPERLPSPLKLWSPLLATYCTPALV